MIGVSARYVAACHQFDVTDRATRCNVGSTIVPYLERERRGLVRALWWDRGSRRHVGRLDRQSMQEELRVLREAIRTAGRLLGNGWNRVAGEGVEHAR